ncbi:hypothetical protein [Kutzneria sp. 744]|uniref:hypothetical protein n=1 Tax=Kutzneria sp. (strain 744) TaxID=345341 RepID=UPI0004B5D4EA|nr:hypothetical protein [Kutzneria sp. 744]
MRERELRRRCRRLLNSLDIRPPLDVVDLCERVGRQRGKPIQLVEHSLPVPGPFGAWISTPSVEFILYQKETSGPHQNHIILHELGHILAEHASDGPDSVLVDDLHPGDVHERYPDLDPGAVRRALRRTSYDTADEQEAELVATIILEWASVIDVVAPRTATDEQTKNIDNALTDRLGWL